MHTRRTDWLVPVSLMVLSAVPVIAGIARVAGLANGSPATADSARFHAEPTPVILHIIAAIPYSVLGALQFSKTLRQHGARWHRISGRILIPCALLVAITGLWMTLTYSWPAGDGVAVFVERLVFGTAMLVSVALGINAIRQRDFRAHADWMTRSYAIALAAGTQVLTHLPWFLFMSEKPGESARALMMGAGWVLNVLVAEWAIRRSRPRRVAITVSAKRQHHHAPTTGSRLQLQPRLRASGTKHTT
ncbi:MAG: DUF2306 domain-containing protein [Gemmatimonadaceae bacterium]|nr:DUF2306 domain-containing protein [Gemmatimonadaceae bacterium]